MTGSGNELGQVAVNRPDTPGPLLTGNYHRNLDEKFRFALPKRLRDVLSSGQTAGKEQTAGQQQTTGQKIVLYLAPGTDGSLVAYTHASFVELGQTLGQQSPTGQDIRAFSRLFYAQAQRVESDRQGRIRIPADLAQLALPRREIVLLGVRDHLELWDKLRWEQYLHGKQPFYDQLAESALSPPGQKLAVPPRAFPESPAEVSAVSGADRSNTGVLDGLPSPTARPR